MEQPLVTVIVVSYNHSRYIKQNLDSIRKQTYSNIQLIVADDASSDDSIDAYEQWLKETQYPAERNFHSDNTGLATMLNECIALAKGKYIKLIAADDFMHPEAIEKSVSLLESLGDEYGMSFSNTHTVDDNGTIIEDISNYDSLKGMDPQTFKRELLKENRIPALTVLLKANVIKETGKYDIKFIVEDYFRWLKISEKYLIAYIPEKLAYYRRHPENISKIKAERIEMEVLILQMMFDKDGILKDKINSRTHRYFLFGKLFDEYSHAYSAYPYRTKRLDIAIRNKLPTLLYKIINKVAELKM